MIKRFIFTCALLTSIVYLSGCKDQMTNRVNMEQVINNAIDNEEGRWVEVSLEENNNKVFVRDGDKIIREMVCSGGTKDEPSITGTYYLQNRGLWFYSERFKEGATYWVRIKDQYLFHGIPRDKDWNIIKEEEEKLGQLASHGCIRLSEEDAKWFYENVPDGTKVIIHY